MKISTLKLRAAFWRILAHILSFAELFTGLFSTYCIGALVAGSANLFLGVLSGIGVFAVTVTVFFFFRSMVSTAVGSIMNNKSPMNALYHSNRYAAGISEMIFSAKSSCLIYGIVIAVCMFFSMKIF